MKQITITLCTACIILFSCNDTKTDGTTATMILGGRYQESINKGSMMGQPFEGRSIVGYDNAKKMLVSSWVDNMGTGMMTMEGTWDSTTHSVNFKGKVVDPMTGKDMDCRETFTMIDDNTQKIEMWCTQYGKEMKTMEINFKRR